MNTKTETLFKLASDTLQCPATDGKSTNILNFFDDPCLLSDQAFEIDKDPTGMASFHLQKLIENEITLFDLFNELTSVVDDREKVFFTNLEQIQNLVTLNRKKFKSNAGYLFS